MNERQMIFAVPGSDRELIFERAEDGRLSRILGGGRVYLEAGEDGRTVFDGGFVTSTLTALPGGLLRTLQAHGRTWIESFAWDSKGLLTEIDGVRIGYDDQQRVVSCRDAEGDWFYAYSGSVLSVIDSPQGCRQIIRGEDGRPLGMRVGRHHFEIFYDSEGRRLPRLLKPTNWYHDAAGRLWTVKDGEGRVVLTYLWDAYHCLGYIAGDVGEPLAMVFSLDPTGTPIRLIDRKSIRRLARDAFGESLLKEHAVPGLFGGAILDGLVYLPFRRLDSCTGSFDAPDPMRGEESDPRRAAGYKGPLLAELPPSGPYTVCRNNPVTLTDPTGAISDFFWLVPSALTWSLQNTIGSLVGMWLNMEFSPLGMIVSAICGKNPFDMAILTANNYFSFGLRSDGYLAGKADADGTTRTWTYQFLVNGPSENFSRLEHARLFAPGARFQPRLYGSVLRCVPEGGDDAFLLQGQRVPPNGAPLINWSRNGGTAEPVIPGSLVPAFPAGGIHFGKVQRNVGQKSATLVELEPSGALLKGTISQRALVTFSRVGLGLATNGFVVLTSTAGVVEVARVLAADEENGKTLVRLDTSGGTLGTKGIRLEGLSALVGTENLTPVAGQAQRLGVTGSSNDYRPGLSVLRLNRNNAPLGSAKVTALEAQIALDEALPATLGNSLRVRPAVASGNFNATLTANANVFQVTSGTVPGPGTGVVVGSGTNAIAALVQTINGQQVTVDRAVSALGGDGTAVTWQNLAPLPAVGLRSGAPETQSQITYASDRAGTAPATGFVWIEGSGIATRRITALNYDAIVLGQALPDALPTAFSVERFNLQAPDVSGGTLTSAQLLALNAAPPSNAKAFHVVELNGAALAAGSVIQSGVSLSGNVGQVSISATVSGLAPGEIVALTSGTNPPEPAVVQRLRLTLTLNRNLTLNPNGLELVMLDEGVTYNAIRRGDRTVRIQPSVSGNTTDLPRFFLGELVKVTWSGPSPGERLYRIQFVNGSTITGANDEDVIPANATGLQATRLTVVDPGSGSSRLGIDGEALSPTQVRFDVWTPGIFNLGDKRLGIVDGQNVFAVNLVSGNQPLDIVFLTAPPLTGTVDVAKPALASATASGFSARFTLDGASLIFRDTPLTSPTGLILAVPYIETTRRVSGKLNSGKVRIPNDHENVSIELDRRQALEDHELAHTQTSAKWGPFMLAWFPYWAMELLGESLFNVADFSAYGPATVGDGNLITIPAIAGVTIDAGDDVQVAQSGRAETITLGEKTGDVYTLTRQNRRRLADKNIVAGPAQARLVTPNSGLVITYRVVQNVFRFLTVGGLVNVVSAFGWGGVFWIAGLIQAAVRSWTRNEVTAQLAADHVTLTLAAGQGLDGLAANSLLSIQSGNQTFVRPVSSVSGQTVVLATAAPLEGEVRISAYSGRGDGFPFALTYFPATFPDQNRPAALQVQPLGGDRLSLNVNDWVHIKSSGGHDYDAVVTAVGANGLIEVDEATLLSAGETPEFLIAKLDNADQRGFADNFFLSHMRQGWMQYINDPWGQISYLTNPTSTFGKILKRSARYLFGTQNWSIVPIPLPPPFGFYWKDRAYREGKVTDATGTTLSSGSHRSKIEQEASYRSGDTYCPIGTLHGDLSFVGDIARYWLTTEGGLRDADPPNDMIDLSFQDRPGSALTQSVRLTPNGATGPTGGSGATGPTGLFVPEVFSQITSTLGLDGVGPRGWIPINSTLERTAGAYVAFTRPTSGSLHVITGQNISGVRESEDAELNGFPNIIRFQKNVADVTVTLATIPVPEGTPIDLIPSQRAAFVVTPNGNRVYRATLLEPGAIANIENNLEIVMLGIAPAAAPGGLATENVEVSRFYRFNTATGTYDSGLGAVNLPTDIDIAVRRLQIRLVDTLPMRANPVPTDPAITTILPGNPGIILIPAPFLIAAITTAFAGTPPHTPQITPRTPVPANAQAFIRDGGIVNVLFPADQPPEAAADMVITIPVGPAPGPTVPVTCRVTVSPHFTLDSGTGFNVSAGSPLTLQSSDGTVIELVGTLNGITVSPPPATNQLVLTVTTAPPGTQIVLVRDTTDNTRMARRTITVT